MHNDLPDIQNTKDTREKKIQKVGVREVRVPIKIKQNDKIISTVAECSIYTSLSPCLKGSNLSRYLEVLHDVIKDSVSTDIIRNMLIQLKDRLESEDSYVKFRFTYFLKKEAPVSKKMGYMDYDCIFEGSSSVENGDKIYLTVNVPYKSLCACSKEISNYGAHNQRSFASVKVEVDRNNIILIEDIISIVEQQASAPVYGILKRPDEKYVTEQAYDNPKFTEDMARDIAIQLDKLNDKVLDYAVVIEHQDSIHKHNCMSIINAGKELK